MIPNHIKVFGEVIRFSIRQVGAIKRAIQIILVVIPSQLFKMMLGVASLLQDIYKTEYWQQDKIASALEALEQSRILKLNEVPGWG